MGRIKDRLHISKYIANSKFVKTVFLRVLAITLIVSLAIIAIVFFSFSSETNENIIDDKQAQQSIIENSISKRSVEMAGIAYNISQDSAFYLTSLDERTTSNDDMSSILERYLVGNSFIKYLGFYRVSEPNTFYTSSGVLTLNDFWNSYLDFKNCSQKEYLSEITKCTSSKFLPLQEGNLGSYITYVSPIPQFSAHPQAYIVMLIAKAQLQSILDTQIEGCSGKTVIFDASYNELFSSSSLDEDISITEEDLNDINGSNNYKIIKAHGEKYLLQKQLSDNNGFVFASLIRQKDITATLDGRQLIPMALILILMVVSVSAILISIIKQYKPINTLVDQVKEQTIAEDGSTANHTVDERNLLSDIFASLKDDSEQKQLFEKAYYESEAANRAKSTFLSNMSHDIRTPMNAIIGMSAIAYKHSDDPEYVRDCLHKIRFSSQYLLDIINDVLDMSRIESGKLTITENVIDLKKIIFALKTIIEPSANEKHQSFIIKDEGIKNNFVFGDHVRLTQIFVNILSNSVKFTPEGGTISIEVSESSAKKNGYGSYKFVFSDTGIGMSPEFVFQVYDTFTRAEDADSSQIEGTGLGMSIAKRLVELMDGTIKCESQLGVGTTFTVTLELKTTDDSISSKDDNVPTEYKNIDEVWNSVDDDTSLLQGGRVLLVEDNPINREVAIKMLSEIKVDVTVAVNGQEAVNKFADNPGEFDLILMDIQMPVMDGYEATKVIRSMSRVEAKTIPIYAMSANTFDEDRKKAKEIGMTGHLNKPYMPNDLYAIIKDGLKK